jgi:hypothetical protein
VNAEQLSIVGDLFILEFVQIIHQFSFCWAVDLSIKPLLALELSD